MSRVLVIDDEDVIRDLMREILERAGHETVGAERADDALALLDDDGIALVVSDIVMPGLNGLELLEEVRARRPSLPVILVTGAGTYENLSEAVARGADGLVIKPFSHADLQNAVAGALERARRAEHDLRERLLAPTLAAALAGAIEARNGELSGHCERLAELAVLLAEELRLPSSEVEQVRLGALLHDVGKIAIPDRVLLKNGPFTDEERALMRTHPEIGDRVLEPLDFLPEVRAIVRHHHERWDGTGYPDGLAGESIPLYARIVAISDAIEAMSGPRAYRAPLSQAALVDELREGTGRQWDPHLVETALALIEERRIRFDAEGIRLDPACRSAAGDWISVLLVDREQHAVQTVASIEAAGENVRVVHARDVEMAKELFRSSRWSLAVIDADLPEAGGLELLETIKERAPSLPVVMLTREGAEDVALDAYRRGAADYVVKSNGYASELSSRVRAFLEAA